MPTTKSDRFAKRRNRLQQLVKKAGADGILITSMDNVTYLTGFTGHDSYLLVNARHAIMLSDTRYEEQLGNECPDIELDIRRSGMKMVDSIAAGVKKCKISNLAIEAASVSLQQYESIHSGLPATNLVSTSGLVEQLREIKDADEVAAIRRAVFQAERTFDVIRSGLRGDQTECEIANDIEYQIRKFGGRGCAFDPIVAVGPRAALPHATPGHSRIDDDDFVLIDWGACEHLYRSDLTRVLVTGKISPKLRRIYGVVLEAQLAAIAAVRPGAIMSEVDAVARSVIAKAGYGKNFGHGLGHGIGIEIHESTRLASDQDRPLKAGMVITIEPGIYIPGWGGVRIEDDLLVTRQGHEVLTSQPKELEECVVSLR